MGTYSGGNGQEATPYRIGTVADWVELSETSDDWSAYFVLINDIDFSGVADIPSVGNGTTSFNGSFDGDEYTMSNLSLATTTDVNNRNGLFQKIGATAVIKDLTLDTITIVGTSPQADWQSYCGGLVGESTSGSAITNCHVENVNISHIHSIAAKPSYVGGLIGASHGAITNCTVSGTVKGQASAGTTTYIGGFVGTVVGGVDPSVITGCSANASVGAVDGTGAVDARVGGFAGTSAHDSTITTSTSTGSVDFTNAANLYVGGFNGDAAGEITNCTASGTIKGKVSAGTLIYVGGFIGSLTGGAEPGAITGCSSSMVLSSADVPGAVVAHVGGFAGTIGASSTLTTSNFTGSISFTNGASLYIGGLVGSTNGSVTNSYSEPSGYTAVGTAGTTKAGGFSGVTGATAAISACYSNAAMRVGYSLCYGGGFTAETANGCSIVNSYCLGSMYDLKEGSSSLKFNIGGGFVGSCPTLSTITNCWSAMSYASGAANVKAFVGVKTDPTAFTSCFWNNTLNGITADDSIDGTTAHTTAELQDISVFTAAGYDIDPADGRYWKGVDGMYPILEWEVYPFGGGSGTETDPWQIDDAVDYAFLMAEYANYTSDVYAVLHYDVELGDHMHLLYDTLYKKGYPVIKRGGPWYKKKRI